MQFLRGFKGGYDVAKYQAQRATGSDSSESGTCDNRLSTISRTSIDREWIDGRMRIKWPIVCIVDSLARKHL